MTLRRNINWGGEDKNLEDRSGAVRLGHCLFLILAEKKILTGIKGTKGIRILFGYSGKAMVEERIGMVRLGHCLFLIFAEKKILTGIKGTKGIRIL